MDIEDTMAASSARQLIKQVPIIIAVWLLCTGTCVFILYRLISPIGSLRQFTQEVFESKDYALRSSLNTSNEIGQLSNNINSLLSFGIQDWSNYNNNSSYQDSFQNDFENKKEQTVNEKVVKVRQTFDQYPLISALHSFLSVEDKKYLNILPPLTLLDAKLRDELLNKLKEIDFILSKNIAA